MRFEQPVPVSWIAEFINARLLGNGQGQASGINELHQAEPGDIVFVDNSKYYDTCIQSAASFIIINKKTDIPEGKALLIVDDPFEDYLKLINHFRAFTPSLTMKSETAIVIMDHCIVGNNVIIQAGTVIGSDAFYYNNKTNRAIHYKKMNSCSTGWNCRGCTY